MKTTLIHNLQRIGVLAAMTLFSLPAMASSPHISAKLEPANVTVGQQAQLTVTVTGASGEEPAVPHVDGLDITPMGQSSEFESVNGVTTASNSQIYLVTPTRAGRFTIPSLKLGNGTEATQPIVLQATGSAAAPSAGTPPAALPAPNVPGADDDQAVSAGDQQTFLRLVMPKRSLYVGELVPVQIKAYFRSGLQASVNGLPSLSSDAFTLNALDDKPEQTQEIMNGQRYTVLTWTTAVCAVKAGDYSLSLEMPVVLTVPAHSPRAGRRGLLDDPFDDDSFFDNFFGNSVEKQITLSSRADVETVRPLPSGNKPPGFSGAVGDFTVTAQASPDHVAAGDPITLRLTVTGSGNFDRVASNLLGSSADWKSYKPVARFTPTDSVGFEGTKTFEQAVVPLKSGQVKIPALSFSYFDPQTEKYVTRSAAPLAVDVSPETNQPATPSGAGSAASSANANPSTFAPNRVETGQFVSTLKPLFLQPRFLLANLFAWCGLAVLHYLLSSHVRRVRDPQFAKARQTARAIHDQLVEMDAAMRRTETATFFAAARRALQHRLGQRWGLPPETITLTEINARLNGNGAGIRPVFQMADQVAYSHENLPAGDLAGWKRIVTEQLKNLETL